MRTEAFLSLQHPSDSGSISGQGEGGRERQISADERGLAIPTAPDCISGRLPPSRKQESGKQVLIGKLSWALPGLRTGFPPPASPEPRPGQHKAPLMSLQERGLG